jgi:hypothetical protein
MTGLSFDGSINIGQVAELLLFFIAGGIAYGANIKRLDEVQGKMGDLQTELSKITDILIQNAARDEREKAMVAQLNKHDRLIENLQDRLNTRATA